MTTTLTGSDSYSNTATAPADGDLRNASSVNTPMQTVLNNTRYLYQHGRIVAFYSFNGTGSYSTTSTYSTTLQTCVSQTIAVTAGDIIVVVGQIGAVTQSSGAVANQGTWLVNFNESSTDHVVYEFIHSAVTGTTVINYIAPHCTYTAASTGNVVVSLKMKNSTADGTNNQVRFAGGVTGDPNSLIIAVVRV